MKNSGVPHGGTEAPVFSDAVQQAVLAAGVGQAFDVPAGGRQVNFGADCNFIARFGSTGAAIPTTSTTAASSALGEMNPSSRCIGSTIACTGYSLISPTSGIITAAWGS